jgi:hypothetical protein
MSDDHDDLPPESAPETPGPPARGRGRRRSVIPDLVRRAVEIGVEKTPDNVKQFVGDIKLPKEIAQVVFSQIDETKNGLFRVVAKELRDFLEQTNFSGELQKLLTTVQFEVNTTIRFSPNDGKTDKAKKKKDKDADRKKAAKAPSLETAARTAEAEDEDPLDDPEPDTDARLEADADEEEEEAAQLMAPESDREPLPRHELETSVQRKRRER